MPGPNAPYTQLDANQVLKQVFDETNDRLRVDAAVTVDEVVIDIDQATDSIRIGDGTDLVTATVDGAKVGLDVSVMNDAYNTGWSQGITAVNNTSTNIISSPLANRRLVILHNDGPETVFYGPSGSVTTSLPLFSGQTVSLAIGPDLDIFGITASGSSNIRFQELA